MTSEIFKEEANFSFTPVHGFSPALHNGISVADAMGSNAIFRPRLSLLLL